MYIDGEYQNRNEAWKIYGGAAMVGACASLSITHFVCKIVHDIAESSQLYVKPAELMPPEPYCPVLMPSLIGAVLGVILIANLSATISLVERVVSRCPIFCKTRNN